MFLESLRVGYGDILSSQIMTGCVVSDDTFTRL